MAANFTQFPIETATITERVASNPATLPLAGTETLLIDQGGTTKGATAAAIAATLPEATTTDAGKLSVGDKAKLNSIASNATANASDAELRDRATHTGEQAISTVTGLQTALDGKEAAGAAASAQSAAISAAATDATTKANAAQSAAISAAATDATTKANAAQSAAISAAATDATTKANAAQSAAISAAATDATTKANAAQSAAISAAATDATTKAAMQLNRQQSAQQRQTRPQRPMQLNRQQSAQQRQTRPQRLMQLNQQQLRHRPLPLKALLTVTATIMPAATVRRLPTAACQDCRA
jgi:flagellar biosynthesis GTPase FlhF